MMNVFMILLDSGYAILELIKNRKVSTKSQAAKPVPATKIQSVQNPSFGS